MSLSELEQLLLLGSGLNERHFYDARGRTISSCREEMRLEKKYFAFNTKPCRRGGHTLRTASNHCIVCNPQAMSHYKKRMASGLVYIAVSPQGRVFKVGVTEEPKQRQRLLRTRRYAGHSDWELIWTFWTESAGFYEAEIQKHLVRFFLPGRFTHNGEKLEQSNEIFRCNWAELAAAVRLVFPSNDLVLPTQMLETEFNFRERSQD